MSVTDAIAAVVNSLVPQTKHDDRLRRELVQRSRDILDSHIGSSRQLSVRECVEKVNRKFQKEPAKATQFTELATRFEDEAMLSRKDAVLTFLTSLPPASQSHPFSSVPFQPLGELSAFVSPPIGGSNKSRSQATSSPGTPRRSSKAELLRYYRSRSNNQQLPERVLIRDCLYLMQGIAGKYVHFEAEDDEKRITFLDDNVHTILQPTKALIHRLSEVGHLYTRVSHFIQEINHRQDVGMIEQSLSRHLQRQLTEYYRLVALLESHLANTSSVPMGRVSPQDPSLPSRSYELTLHRLDVWVDDWRLRLRMMSVCVESCKDAQGGALVSLIHGYTDNGDPFIRSFTDALLEDVSSPFFATLQRWLFDGELRDPYAEFFVALNPELLNEGIQDRTIHDFEPGNQDDAELIRPEGEGGRKLWQTKYIFRKETLPRFVDELFGKKIFSTGKSLNFIRYNCHDSDWTAARDEIGSAGRSLRYSDIPGLERSINDAYRVASQRLLNVFLEKFRLLDHLNALKHYLMLGYGDFADQLMEALGPNLSRPANALYRHNLTATLEAAIRSSNAQNDDPEVLRRLDARMLEYSHGEIGWDVFTLEYKVDAPIDTVLDPDSMVAYMKVFNHLWKLKRLEGTLSRGWMRIAGGARTFLKGTELAPQWRSVRIVMAEMIHFVRQLQGWCQLDVIECSWKKLVDFLNKKEGDLDAVIEAHQMYLDRIVSKILLRTPKAGKEQVVLSQALEIFQLILQFRDAVDNFYNATLAEAARQDTQMDELRGVVTGTELPSSAAQDNLGRVIKRVQNYGSLFSEKVQSLVHSLQVHTDPDCRFLAIRLSFSDYYRSKARVTS